MAEASEQQAISRISAEVDDAQNSVILTTHLINAQAFLVQKLKKQGQLNTEKCEYISSANMKLQSEITQAKQEIKSFLISKDTIRMANVELKKEVLVAREKRRDLIERLETGEQKYENMWLNAKNRYESLPHVKKLQESTEKEKSLKDHITALDKQAELLAKEIEAKKEACLQINKESTIKLAEFLVKDLPNLILRGNEMSKAITELSNELTNLNIETFAEEKAVKKDKPEAVEVNAPTTSVDQNRNVDESALIMPKLQLDSLDLDDLISVKLDEVKMKKFDYTTGWERRESFSKSYYDFGIPIHNRKTDVGESISSYFSKTNDKNKDENNSNNKLINILGDIKIDANDAIDMISKVNPGTLQLVDSIPAGDNNVVDTCDKNKGKEPIQSEEIEDIDMTKSITESIVKPPTQFLDDSLRSQQLQKSQDVKKTVSFDLPSTSQSKTVIEITNEENIVGKESNVPNSQLDLGDAFEGFMMNKDLILKKHNLDLTPPFVYGKNINLQKKTENKVVTSKFFQNNNIPADEPNAIQKEKENTTEILAEKTEIEKEVPKAIPQENTFMTMMMNQKMNTKVIELDVEQVSDQDTASSPKKPKIDSILKPDKPFGGYLFRHGPQGLPESLDLSMNTTGYEDGDIDFAHGIDSSLLLSPKADIPMGSDNIEGQSQEAPSFLSGLRKKGGLFSFLPAGDSKAESSTPNQGFNFNFGEEKKNRGGLFSLFQ